MSEDLPIDTQEGPETCGVCGRVAELFELPGWPEKLCLACSADLGTAVILRTEIDTATLAGQNAESLVAEFAALSRQLLMRAQSAGTCERW
jgi:hypothetical protein